MSKKDEIGDIQISGLFLGHFFSKNSERILSQYRFIFLTFSDYEGIFESFFNSVTNPVKAVTHNNTQ